MKRLSSSPRVVAASPPAEENRRPVLRPQVSAPAAAPGAPALPCPAPSTPRSAKHGPAAEWLPAPHEVQVGPARRARAVAAAVVAAVTGCVRGFVTGPREGVAIGAEWAEDNVRGRPGVVRRHGARAAGCLTGLVCGSCAAALEDAELAYVETRDRIR